MDYTTIGKLTPHLFVEIHKINPDLKIFSVVTPELLDSAYLFKFSSRICTPVVLSTTIDNIAGIVNAMFAQKWDTLFDSVKAVNSSVVNAGEHTTETTNSTNTPDVTTEITGQVSPYDSAEFANNDKTTTTNKGTTTTHTDREYTRTTPNANTTNNIFQYLKNNPLYDTMFTDVNSVLTLNIFESEV